MTLLVTMVSKYGIVHLSDSHTSNQDQVVVTDAKKIFCVPNADIAVSVSGSYRVDSQAMDGWMPIFLQKQSDAGNITPAGIAQALRKDLTSAWDEGTDAQIMKYGGILHVAGYTVESGISHPECWSVRNREEQPNSAGIYVMVTTGEFMAIEHFWTKYQQDAALKASIQSGSPWHYINGSHLGRRGLGVILEHLYRGLNEVWSINSLEGINGPQSLFRSPRSIEEVREIGEFYLRGACLLYRLSDYKIAVIGGEIQSEMIPVPLG